MRSLARYSLGMGGVALAGAGLLLVPGLGGKAADHVDPAARTDPAVDSTPDRAADLADLYAYQIDDSIVLIITFAGPEATTEPAVYDPDVLYTIHVSNAFAAASTEVPIYIRFGTTGGDNPDHGVQVTGIPGVTGAIAGPVQTTIMKDGVKVFAGLTDDPFFFDSQGFRETRSTGDLSFDSNRDFFSAQNITSVVIEMPSDRLANGDNPLNIWAEAARFGGQL